ncbi:hypothetical protein JOF56_003758 [Kibdelosporangium banguiense]|uniref:Uncharacterized protein n=1 Tax=Kibdelosporangium banguiense TaxID=1365924 RepID=A0ABS4TG26_9PSEU|nr:hypothetical protein [Kibdelosporangium banguiense]MBP2323373.1 hypothetical protein [Kibdelosporangium banguiense]
MNLHRFTEAYDSVSATRLRNKSAQQVLNCALDEKQRDRALVIYQGVVGSKGGGLITHVPNGANRRQRNVNKPPRVEKKPGRRGQNPQQRPKPT